MSNDSISKTLIVALLLCVACSIVVATSAVVLKPIQVENKLLDKKKNILAAAGLMTEDANINELFETIEIKHINIRSGEYVEAPTGFDQRKSAKDPDTNIVLVGDEDVAQIKRQSQIVEIYLAKNSDGQLERIILPVHGYGLWSTLYGFLALQSDGNTVIGLGFYDHAETPGLGGEVDNPSWKKQWEGKNVFNQQGDPLVQLVKGGVDKSRPGAIHQVDSLSGATLTSRGVENLLMFWLGENGFGPFLSKLQEQGV